MLQSTPSVPAAVSPQVFVGTWVGTQAWNISAPPPGTDQQQPVTLTIDYIDGKLVGTLTPFMGGDDGAVFVDTRIVGDELHATATFGRPSQPGTAASTASKAPADEDEDQPRIVPKTRARRTSWKDTVKIQFVLKADRLDLKGTGDVTMNDVKWLKFKYDLSKKRSRY
ncbi:MAG TPA: hypothetical protein VLV86_20855 [Vicinamibacterales bacterium]|nr:hypothetical protein [Vicinamibacterales bacterium]